MYYSVMMYLYNIEAVMPYYTVGSASQAVLAGGLYYNRVR